MRIVVAGGGYAGIACLARLSRLLPRAERHLLDASAWHLRRTRLHEVLRRPLGELRVDLSALARRWRFRHHHVHLDWTPARLAQWSARGRLPLGRGELAFDALVIATGLRQLAAGPPAGLGVVALDSLATGPGVAALKRLVRARDPVWVAGAGPSGLQCLFELAEARPGGPLGVVEAEDEIMAAQPRALRRHVAARLRTSRIEVRTAHRYAGWSAGRMRLAAADGTRLERAAGVLLCTGPVRPRLDADASGRVLAGGAPLARVFAAGDCARWVDVAHDAATAQAAVRKGRHVAGTIARMANGRTPAAWDAPRLGFFLSLGRRDAVGWAFHRAALVDGRAAVAAREAVEARWELLLKGVDTFGAL